GSTRWRSSPARPSALPLRPNMTGAGCSNPSRPIGPHRASCDGMRSNKARERVKKNPRKREMNKSTPAIKSVHARAIVTPMARPVKDAFGVIDVPPLLLIDVATDQGITGRSYLFAYSKVTLRPFVHLIEEVGRELVGKAVVPFDLMAAMDAKFRLLGWQG